MVCGTELSLTPLFPIRYENARIANALKENDERILVGN